MYRKDIVEVAWILPPGFTNLCDEGKFFWKSENFKGFPHEKGEINF